MRGDVLVSEEVRSLRIKAWLVFGAVGIISLLLLAAGCGERAATVTPVGSPEPSPITEQATTGPSPSVTEIPTAPTEAEAPTQTPMPVATPTRVPPTPTPTPTYGEQTVSRFSWYANEETNFAAKSQLIGLLLRISEDYPQLFDALIQKAWINPADVPETLEPVVEVVEAIALVTRSADYLTAAVKVLNMPFLEVIEGEEVAQLKDLANLARSGASGFNIFLDHAIAKGGLTDSAREVDINYLYMEAHDAAGMNRVFSGTVPEEGDNRIIEGMIKLYQRYPEVYSTASVHLNAAFTTPNYVDNVLELAQIDEQSARRLAQMPFNSIDGGLEHTAWVFVTRAVQEDSDATSAVLETYEMRGGADHSMMALFLLDVAYIFSPDIVESVRTFDWVKDGVDGPRLREEDWGTSANPSDEEYTIRIILWAGHRNEAWIEKLLTKDWVRDELSSDESSVANRLRGTVKPIAGLLLDMEFLDDVDREDSLLLVPIANFLAGIRDVPGLSFSDVLKDSKINGEITDTNRHLVQSVMDDLLERHGLATDDD